MRSTSYLASASAVAICAAALHLFPSPTLASPAPSIEKDAEAINYDALGNMIWDKASAAAGKIPDLGRPDFSSVDVASIEELLSSEAHNVVDEVKAATDSALSGLKGLFADGKKGFHDLLNTAEKQLGELKADANGWLHAGQVFVDGIEYTKLVHPHFPEYALRITSKKNTSKLPLDPFKKSKSQFCEDDVYTVSGYLDVSESRHLFFAFFESRSNPAKDPLVTWLNGGPGCSSTTGLLFELGPCSIVDENTTKYNKNSWNSKANVIFLDQPASGVGYSYSEDGVINNTPEAAKDYYAFLQLFLKQFPKYSKNAFHIAGESYAGTYIPQFANYIWKQNNALKALEESSASASSTAMKVNLESVLIGNGLTDPAVQFPSVYDYACDKNQKYHLFDPESETCTSLKSKAATCKSLVEQCYKYDSSFTCTPAALYCWSSLYRPLQETGLNLYDVRKTCDRDPSKDGPLCYPMMQAVEKFMNKPDIKKELGVPAKVDFQSCNMQVNQAFLLHGDSMHDSAKQLVPMIDDGIRVLIYAGEADAMCNYIGNREWVLSRSNETSLGEEYAAAKEQTWSVNGKEIGYLRSAVPSSSSKKSSSKKEFGNLSFLSLRKSGHMVPYNEAEAALEMFEHWLANERLDTK